MLNVLVLPLACWQVSVRMLDTESCSMSIALVNEAGYSQLGKWGRCLIFLSLSALLSELADVGILLPTSSKCSKWQLFFLYHCCCWCKLILGKWRVRTQKDYKIKIPGAPTFVYDFLHGSSHVTLRLQGVPEPLARMRHLWAWVTLPPTGAAAAPALESCGTQTPFM